MKTLFLVLAAAGGLCAQGWTQVPNSKFQDACPANGFGVTAGPVIAGMPNYAFADNCHYILDSWGGGFADKKRNWHIIWGGGHSEYYGNEIYAFKVATGEMVRLNNPSPWVACPSGPTYGPEMEVNPDGSPRSRHTYFGMIPLEEIDRYFMWEGAGNCGGSGMHRKMWMFNPNDMTWTDLQPTGFDITLGGGLSAGQSQTGAFCIREPGTKDIQILCHWGAAYNGIVRYNATTNVASLVKGYSTTVIPVGGGIPAMSTVVDPQRRMWYFIGRSYHSGTLKMHAIDVSPGSTYAVQDLTAAAVTGGCGPLGVDYPGLDYDPVINRIVAWPNTGNTVYIFDPVSMTCVGQTWPNGPTGSAGVQLNGTLGRFVYFPALGKYSVISNSAANAFTFTLNRDAVIGLGASTGTCIDRDGDLRGMGPGCSGPDADDLDSTVYTREHAIAKYGDLLGWLRHKGYEPKGNNQRIWHLSNASPPAGVPAGNDATCKTAGNAPVGEDFPCQLYSAINAYIAQGDIIILRDQWNGRITTGSGAAGKPIMIMSYPGEMAFIEKGAFPSALIAMDNLSYITIDGVKVGNGACIISGTTNGQSQGLWNNNIIRRYEGTNCGRGIFLMNGLNNFTLEDAILYSNPNEHGAYLGAREHATDRLMLRRVIAYDNPYNGIQWNGRCTNCFYDSALAWGNGIAGFTFYNGWKDSTAQNLVAYGNGSTAITIKNYNGDCDSYFGGGGFICPYDITGNLFQKLSLYVGGRVPKTGASNYGWAGIAMYNNTTDFAGDMKYNTFRDVAIMFNGNGSNSSGSAFQIGNRAQGYPANTTIQGLVFKDISNTNTAALKIGVETNSEGGSAPDPAGSTTLHTCATAGAQLLSLSGCVNTDPGFTAVNTAWYTLADQAQFNLRLLAASPAIAAGYSGSTTRPLWDATGAARSLSSPTIGAYEYLDLTAPLSNRRQSGVSVRGVVLR